MAYKKDFGLPMTMSTEDIIPCFNKAWECSFNRVHTNKRAISDRGWNPPNRKLLTHPDLKKQVTPSSTTSDASMAAITFDASDLNFETGLSAKILDRIIQHGMRTGGIEKRRQKLAEGQSIASAVADGRKLTSGFLVSNGSHSLTSKDLIDAIRLNMEKKKTEKIERNRTLRQELKKRSSIVAGLDRKKMDNWSAKDCKIFLQWKKTTDDPAMPTGIVPLRARCKEWVNRPSPNISPSSSDDEVDPKEQHAIDSQQWREAGDNDGMLEIVDGIAMAQA